MGDVLRAVVGFGDRAPDFTSPLGVSAWLTEPLGVVTAMTRPMPIDDRLADFLTGTLHAQVRARALPAERTFVLHDWSLATSYDARTRLRLTRWVVAHRHEHKAIGVVAPPTSSPLRMGAEVAHGVLALAGIPFDLVDEIGPWMERNALRVGGQLPTLRPPSLPPPRPLLRTG